MPDDKLNEDKRHENHDKRLYNLEANIKVHAEHHKGLDKMINRIESRVRDVESNLSWQAKIVIVAVLSVVVTFLFNWILGDVFIK